MARASGAIEKPRFERSWWHSYRDVNAIFAERALAALAEEPDAITWVHDCHLMLVPHGRGRDGRPLSRRLRARARFLWSGL